jgi:hypothetical protein
MFFTFHSATVNLINIHILRSHKHRLVKNKNLCGYLFYNVQSIAKHQINFLDKNDARFSSGVMALKGGIKS